MARVLYMRTCPKCGERVSLLTITHENGHVAKAVFCSSSACNVNTGFTYGELPDVVRRWNAGIGLEYKDGRPYCKPIKHRPFVPVVVEL